MISLGDASENLMSIICKVSNSNQNEQSWKLYNAVKRAQHGLCSLKKTNSHYVNYALVHNVL